MGDNSKKPGIRFKGFTDDWEQRKFADYYKMSSGYAFKMTDYCDDGAGLINGESIQHGIINDDNLNHLPESFIEQYPEFVLKEGDIVVGLNRPITNGNLKIARIPSKYNNFMLYQRAGKIVYKAGCDKDFSYILLSQEILKHTLVEAVGSDQPFISTSKLDKWKIMMPMNIEEQEKIGVYFSNLDHIITLHQRKYDKLVVIKKSMLEKMFPKDGQTKPEIRFSGFTDDWEQRKFADYYKMSSGYAFKMTDYCDDGAGLINGESIQHGIINDDNLNHLPESFIEQYPEFVLKEGDIVVGLNRPITNGNLKIARIPSKYNNFMLYQRAGKIVYKAGCDKDFSYILLSQEILKHTLVEAVGSDQPFISTSKLDKWKIMMPMNIEEQEKIGVYFSNLDHIITLHQRELEKLKKIKLSMLEKMFV